MKISVFILFFFFTAGLYAIDFSSKVNVDSIYDYLTPEQKIRQIIWWDLGDENADLPPSHLNQNIGAIYLGRPLHSYEEMIFETSSTAPLAVQLDQRLNPSPQSLDNLPSLLTLASIRDREIVKAYVEYLEQICRSYKISYAVLPQVGSDSSQLWEVLNLLHDLKPNFFLHYQKLNFQHIQKKKEAITALNAQKYLIVDDDSYASTSKYLPKVLKKIDITTHSEDIQRSISNKFDDSIYPNVEIPGKLNVKINRASIIPIQKTSNVLPITKDTICLMTSRPDSRLVKMMSKYAYIIFSLDEVKSTSIPIVIENQQEIPEIGEDHTVIFIGQIDKSTNVVDKIDGGLITTRESALYDYLLPQLLFGATNASGRLPVDHGEWASFSNEPIIDKGKLGYAPPEMIGLDSTNQIRIKEIVEEAIRDLAIPGCQVAVAVDGSILYEEGFGHLTYDSLIAVTDRTIYDLASVTKVTATLLAVIKLTQEKKLHIDSTISYYLPKYEGTNKADITLRSILSHNAGLKSYVPFWKQVLGADRLESFYYASEEDAKNDRRSYGLKPSPVLLDSLENWIRKSPVRNNVDNPKYVYSDIGFMILHQVVEAVAEQPMDQYLDTHFYTPLGLKTTHFNPLTQDVERFEIAPTEYDYYFRDEQVWGDVHDRNAAVFGGVAGHAGLFSNARELLIITQMLLQEGFYDGENYLEPAVLNYFNNRYYTNNRRALGWDKRSNKSKNTSKYASDESFGHTGFTGTMIWIDPAYDLAFVFLSNRIYPDANNYKLNRANIRTRIQDVVYEAILTKWTE